MIIHRIARALRRQHWTTLVIETVIVVFGVYRRCPARQLESLKER